ncbi:MAG TPA: hypothetical protein VE338_09885 [Ktedonobacterales bacterium]|nr:hypothetical protein [Ktedonobacterales bacterium]
MALDNRDFGGMDTIVGSAINDSEERAWWWSPEPVRLTPAPAERFEPTRFDVITASFQFPCALVDARAQGLVEGARRDGVRHSLSLWRAALRDALEMISREAAHTPREATCAALFWDRIGEEYRVAVTFESPRTATARRPRH